MLAEIARNRDVADIVYLVATILAAAAALAHKAAGKIRDIIGSPTPLLCAAVALGELGLLIS